VEKIQEKLKESELLNNELLRPGTSDRHIEIIDRQNKLKESNEESTIEVPSKIKEEESTIEVPSKIKEEESTTEELSKIKEEESTTEEPRPEGQEINNVPELVIDEVSSDEEEILNKIDYDSVKKNGIGDEIIELFNNLILDNDDLFFKWLIIIYLSYVVLVYLSLWLSVIILVILSRIKIILIGERETRLSKLILKLERNNKKKLEHKILRFRPKLAYTYINIIIVIIVKIIKIWY